MIALKVAKAGGMLGTLQCALIADAAGMPYYMGCMMDTGLGTSAYLQTASALRDMSYGAALRGPLAGFTKFGTRISVSRGHRFQ